MAAKTPPPRLGSPQRRIAIDDGLYPRNDARRLIRRIDFDNYAIRRHANAGLSRQGEMNREFPFHANAYSLIDDAMGLFFAMAKVCFQVDNLTNTVERNVVARKALSSKSHDLLLKLRWHSAPF
jgi:hypothetical protein